MGYSYMCIMFTVFNGFYRQMLDQLIDSMLMGGDVLKVEHNLFKGHIIIGNKELNIFM